MAAVQLRGGEGSEDARVCPYHGTACGPQQADTRLQIMVKAFVRRLKVPGDSSGSRHVLVSKRRQTFNWQHGSRLHSVCECESGAVVSIELIFSTLRASWSMTGDSTPGLECQSNLINNKQPDLRCDSSKQQECQPTETLLACVA